jgi:hypothetical protein
MIVSAVAVCAAAACAATEPAWASASAPDGRYCGPLSTGQLVCKQEPGGDCHEGYWYDTVDCHVYESDVPAYSGWAELFAPLLEHPTSASNGGGPAAASTGPPLLAWRWTSAGWRQLRISLTGDGLQDLAYVSPLASGWSWAWRADTNWVAVRNDDVLVGDALCLASGGLQTALWVDEVDGAGPAPDTTTNLTSPYFLHVHI